MIEIRTNPLGNKEVRFEALMKISDSKTIKGFGPSPQQARAEVLRKFKKNNQNLSKEEEKDEN